MKNNRAYTKSELRLATEITVNCLDGDPTYLKKQYAVNFKHSYHGFRRAVLDLAIPGLKIAIRVMGPPHGMSWNPGAKDDIQKDCLEDDGWDVIDVWHDERYDLWM